MTRSPSPLTTQISCDLAWRWLMKNGLSIHSEEHRKGISRSGVANVETVRRNLDMVTGVLSLSYWEEMSDTKTSIGRTCDTGDTCDCWIAEYGFLWDWSSGEVVQWRVGNYMRSIQGWRFGGLGGGVRRR